MTLRVPAPAQHGMAVITAMLLIALAASVASFLLWRQQLWMQHVANLAARAQADALAGAAIEWRRRWPRTGAAPFAEDVDITISDPQGLFNLNNLARGGKPSETDIAAFRRLLRILDLPETLTDTLLDAIDPDSEATFPGGAEDLDYLAMQPARRAPNRPLLDVASLGRIKGFTIDAIARLAPYVSALPEATATNINSAPVEVVRALIPDLDEGSARAIVEERSRKPFESVDSFRAKLPEGARPPASLALSVSSSYYVVTSRARVDGAAAIHRALIGAAGAKREGVVWRTEGSDG